METAHSLQAATTIFIARNIHQYSIAYISSLPVRLRRDLLCLLPAVDICALENTSVAVGVSLEEVWENVWRSREKVLGQYAISDYTDGVAVEGQQSGCEWAIEKIDTVEKSIAKDAYFNALTLCLFTSHKEHFQIVWRDAQRALFCVPEWRMPIPSNLVRSRVKLFRVLVNCQFPPSLFVVSCSTFVELGYWDRKDEVFPLLAVLLSRVSHVIIYERTAYTGGDKHRADLLLQVFRFLLEAVFSDSGKRPSLTDFKLFAENEAFLIGALHHMADFMSPRLSCGHFTTNIYTKYNGIRHLSVSNERGEIQLFRDPNIDLKMVIEHQVSLHSLYVQGWSCENYPSGSACPEYDQLMHCFGSLFTRPTFSKLRLSHFSYTLSSGNNGLMHKFLGSPIKGQALELCNAVDISLDGCGGSDVAYLDQPPITSGASKALQISETRNVQIAWINPFFCHYLPVYPLCNLSCLVIDGASALTRDTLAAIATLNLTALHFRFCYFMKFGRSSVFTKLFTMPNLTTLELRNVALCHRLVSIPWPVDVIMDHFMETVIEGLFRQASFSKITFLDLSCNRLTKLSNVRLQQLFRAIFKLPQLESLTLSLELNRFTDSQVQLMCQSWHEEADRRMLLKLLLCQQFSGLRNKQKVHACSLELNNLAVTIPCSF